MKRISLSFGLKTYHKVCKSFVTFEKFRLIHSKPSRCVNIFSEESELNFNSVKFLLNSRKHNFSSLKLYKNPKIHLHNPQRWSLIIHADRCWTEKYKNLTSFHFYDFYTVFFAIKFSKNSFQLLAGLWLRVFCKTYPRKLNTKAN